MLSYQHSYHAGNFADVIKHLTLSRVLSYMTQKDKPLFYLETHSGRGVYDLKHQHALKTGEYKEGIDKLWAQRTALPEIFQDYLHSIYSLNTDNDLRFYPGSPAIAIDMLRSQDRLYCCELHPQEFDALKSMKKKNLKVHVAQEDGIKAMNALLPPPEKRSLVFIDPSFELKTEYKTIPAAIHQAYKKCPTAVYCLWYPIVEKDLTEQLHKEMAKIPTQNTLNIEFHRERITAQGMTGTGLFLINPPYLLKSEIETALKVLETLINPGQSFYKVE